PPLLDRIGSEHPRVRILVLDGTTTSLVPQLASASLDLAVVNLPADEPDVVVAPLFDEDAVLVAPASHPLADRAETSFAELAAHPLLLAAPGTAFRLELD